MDKRDYILIIAVFIGMFALVVGIHLEVIPITISGISEMGELITEDLVQRFGK